MLRVPGVSTLASGWGLYAVYICAMGTLGVSTVHATYAVSEGIWHAAAASGAGAPRDLSRVEKFYAAKSAAWRKARPVGTTPVIALVKPDIHPAALAAALDRTELASASEYPEHHPAPIHIARERADASTWDVASWRKPAVQVAGLACSADGCDNAEAADMTGNVIEAGVASAEADAEQIAYAVSDEAAAEAAVEALPKPNKLGKGRGAQSSSVRQKPQRKVLTQYGDEPAIVKFFTYQPGDRGLRVAETPGDIIRLSLLRGTI